MKLGPKKPIDKRLKTLYSKCERSCERSHLAQEEAPAMNQSRATLKQVAARAGVSYQTVSKVLNGQVQVSKETEQRIWQAAEELGYQPNYTARSLRVQRSQTIGYAWEPTPSDQANPILDEFLQSMFHAAERNGYYLLCFPHHAHVQQRIDSYRRLIDSGRVDAFVLSAIEYNDARVTYLCERNFPFVAFGRSNQELCFPYIDVDGGEGLRQATAHLLSQGHTRIAALAWPKDSRVGENRMEGYFTALKSADIQPQPEWLLRGEGSFRFGQRAMQLLLELPNSIRPTAAVALNDMMALGAMEALRQRGLTPGRDFGLTGFDDTPLARFSTPPLTSVQQPIWEIGQQLMSLLLQLLQGGQRPTGQLIEPRLIVRASSLHTA